MNTIENIFDEVIGKAKTVADVAGKKTSEMIEIGKIKYKMKQITWDIEKTYAKLGALVYEARGSGENYDDVIEIVVAEIDDLNTRLDLLEHEYDEYKKAGADSTRETRYKPSKKEEYVTAEYFDSEEDLKQAIEEVDNDII